jgi:hypothetical protein
MGPSHRRPGSFILSLPWPLKSAFSDPAAFLTRFHRNYTQRLSLALATKTLRGDLSVLICTQGHMRWRFRGGRVSSVKLRDVPSGYLEYLSGEIGKKGCLGIVISTLVPISSIASTPSRSPMNHQTPFL